MFTIVAVNPIDRPARQTDRSGWNFLTSSAGPPRGGSTGAEWQWAHMPMKMAIGTGDSRRLH